MSRKRKKKVSERQKSISGIRRKATLCNIWINQGFPNPYHEKQDKLAHKIAVSLSIDLPDSWDIDYVIRWVREYRPDLLMTAKRRRSLMKTAQQQPQASDQNERDAFYESWAWRTTRMEALKIHGRACQCCGATPGMKTISGRPVRIVVDHIKPLSKYWQLRLEISNLQVLCDDCNMGKGNWDETDYRCKEVS